LILILENKSFIKVFVYLMLSLFSINELQAQDFRKIDTIVAKYPTSFKEPKELAQLIAADFKTENDQVRAVFFWIATNVNYNIEEKGKFDFEFSNELEKVEKTQQRNKKLAKRVIQKGLAVCDGYATLFDIVCDELDIRAKKVVGASKTKTSDIGKRFISDHAWNLVEIDSKKYLLDITWASQKNKNQDKIINNFYYLTPPNLFIKNHYPLEYNDALLDVLVPKDDFLKDPLFISSKIEVIKPYEGQIKKTETTNIQFQFLLLDNSSVSSIVIKSGKNQLKIENFKVKNSLLEFEIDMKLLMKEREIIVMINGNEIVGYKLLN
jgi:hypothetical protein